jgi:hypothetical protein
MQATEYAPKRTKIGPSSGTLISIGTGSVLIYSILVSFTDPFDFGSEDLLTVMFSTDPARIFQIAVPPKSTIEITGPFLCPGTFSIDTASSTATIFHSQFGS